MYIMARDMKIYRATRSQTQPDSSDSMTRAAAVWLCCVCVTWHTLQQPGYKINRHVRKVLDSPDARSTGMYQHHMPQHMSQNPANDDYSTTKRL